MLNKKIGDFINKIIVLQKTNVFILHITSGTLDNMIINYIKNITITGNMIVKLYGEIDTIFSDIYHNFSLVDTDMVVQSYLSLVNRFIVSLSQICEECFNIELDEIVKLKSIIEDDSVIETLINYKINKINNKINILQLRIPDIIFRSNEFIAKTNHASFIY